MHALAGNLRVRNAVCELMPTERHTGTEEGGKCTR
jgi:hypothetical protein